MTRKGVFYVIEDRNGPYVVASYRDRKRALSVMSERGSNPTYPRWVEEAGRVVSSVGRPDQEIKAYFSD